MPKRRPTASLAHVPLPVRGNFRDRYDDLETRREQLVTRLRLLGEITQKHPGYKRALTLLNDTFRKSRLAHRLAVLQAAAWLIDILERVTTVL
jgi:hypothetical protein